MIKLVVVLMLMGIVGSLFSGLYYITATGEPASGQRVR